MRRTTLLLTALLTLFGCSLPRWPVSGTLTSPYGLRHHGGLDFRVHRGVDIAVPSGTEVRAMAPGTVEFAGTMRGYGHVVIVDHGGGVRTVYAHLSAVHTQAGQALRGRPVIGLSGASGSASAPHIHFEIIRDGNHEDPVPLLGGFPPLP
ncbi:MAG: M23 family metallopeptidase [Longimicrobiales bacterium]|nr:M23 family metallopeptidase [Longimicrobiales bacterium]